MSVRAAVWQADEAVSACPLCEHNFTWYYRKHHCRKCGRVVCNSCCSNFYSIPSSVVVRPPEPTSPTMALTRREGEMHESGGGAGVEEVRTCDGCFSKLEQDRCRRMLGLDISTLDARVVAQLIKNSATTPSVLASPPPSYSRASIASHAHIPASNATTRTHRHEHSGQGGSDSMRSSRRRRSTLEHQIISSSAPSSRVAASSLPPREVTNPLRYVAFVLNEDDKILGEECSVCFEEYETGQSIARLECWCVFHLTCIKAWSMQKAGAGGCPLHFHD